MTTLPISARDYVRFNPLEDAVLEARQAVEDAKRRISQAESMPSCVDSEVKLAMAQVDLGAAEQSLESAEAIAGRYHEVSQTYFLRVPTYRTKAKFQSLVTQKVQLYQGDQAMIGALKRASADGFFCNEDSTRLEILAASARGHISNPDQTAVLNELGQIAQSHPAVSAILTNRVARDDAYDALNVRFHMVGWEGNGLPEFPKRDGNDLADESIFDHMPLAFISAVSRKINRLAGLDALTVKN